MSTSLTANDSVGVEQLFPQLSNQNALNYISDWEKPETVMQKSEVQFYVSWSYQNNRKKF